MVRSRLAFDLVRSWKGGTLRAGQYWFHHPATVLEVYSRIEHGDVYTKAVTVPEGASMFDVATRLEQAGFGPPPARVSGRGGARLTNLVADLDPRWLRSLEGYLFPDTYHFSRKATPEQIATGDGETLQAGSRAGWIEGERACRSDDCFAGGA